MAKGSAVEGSENENEGDGPENAIEVRLHVSGGLGCLQRRE